MPALETVSEYCEVLGRSRLVPEGEVLGLRQRWEADTDGGETDVELFRKYLVQKRFLTEYQAALVGRGHAEGFFVGGYVIQDRIGKGQSAGVYKAIHTSGQIVALKVLPGSKAKEPNILSRFEREGRLLTQLDHPNVVRAFHVGQSGSAHFIVMEHLDGETLDEVLERRKKLPFPEAARLVHQALLGLEHLYEKRMVHRDLKPTNLMVAPPATPGRPDNTLDATLRILDIGIGRELFDEESTATQDMDLTTEGTILGTPDYLAPEQARDARNADVRADIYSLGCVLFHLITGRTPFQDKNVMAQMVKHATEKAPPLAGLVAGVPPGLQVVVDKMMAKKADYRYQTPGEAAMGLAPFLPENASRAQGGKVLPEFKQWLDTESSMELPAALQKLPLGLAGAGPSGTVPRPAARPDGGKGMPSGVIPKTQTGAGASGIMKKPGSGLHAAVVAGKEGGSGITPKNAGQSGVMPRPAGQSGIVPKPSGVSGIRPKPAETEVINVELVALNEADVGKTRIVRSAAEDDRPLTDLNRRDFTMLGIGAGGVLFAIATGYGLAKGLRAAIGSLNDEPPPTTEGK